MRDELSAETTAAIQSLAREILDEIGATAPVDLAEGITARLKEAVSELLYGERERCVPIVFQKFNTPRLKPTLPRRALSAFQRSGIARHQK